MFALVCAMIYVNIRTLQVLVSPDVTDTDSPVSAPGPNHGARTASIAGVLFGSAIRPEATPVTINQEPSSVSRHFGVELKGTVAGEIAIVVDLETSKEVILHPGDPAGPGRVERISRSELVLIDGTVRETLTLGAPGAPPESTPSRSARNLIERSRLTEILSRVDRLGQEIAFAPVRDAHGESAGYRITSMKPRGFFPSLGLEVNDMITTINGQAIRTVEDLYRVLGEASHATRLTVNLRRNQRDVQMQYEIH